MKHIKFCARGGGSRVGGSHYEYNDELTIDCGAIQDGSGKEKKTTYPQIAGGERKLLVLSHDHFDHCGGLPLFAKAHPEARFLMTPATRGGLELQLYDSLKISDSRQEIAALRHEHASVLFGEKDIESVLKKSNVVSNPEWFSPLAGYRMSFRSAGHKPGAALILIEFPDGTRVLHACDFSLHDHELVFGAKIPEDFLNPDLLVTECTYGALERGLPNCEEEKVRLAEAVKRVLARGGKVLIPDYSSAGPNTAMTLAKAGIPVFTDGMVRDFSRVYRFAPSWCPEDRPFQLEDYPTLMHLDGRTPVEEMVNKKDPEYPRLWKQGDSLFRRALVQSEASFAIVSSSGMAETGPIVGYLESFLENPLNAVIIKGYQARGTQGQKLRDLEKGSEVTFEHERVVGCGDDRRVEEWVTTRQILCDVLSFHISGHSDGRTVAPWIAAINPKKVITVHGDPDVHVGLRYQINRLRPEIEVIGAKNGQSIDLSF